MGGGFDWVDRQSAAFVQLLGLLVYPPRQAVDMSVDIFSSTAKAFITLALVGVGVGVWAYRRNAPLVALGVLWMLIAVVPRFFVHPQPYGGELNAHQFYSAMAGAAMVVAGVVGGRSERGWSSSVV